MVEKKTKEHRKKVTFCMKPSTHKTILGIAKYQAISVGAVNDHIVEQKLQDPIQFLEDRKRDLALEITSINDRIKQLEGASHD